MVKMVRFLDELCMHAVDQWMPDEFVAHFHPASKSKADGRASTVHDLQWPAALPMPPRKGCKSEDLVMEGRLLPEVENLIASWASHRTEYVFRIDDCRFSIDLTVRLPGEDRWLTGELLPH